MFLVNLLVLVGQFPCDFTLISSFLVNEKHLIQLNSLPISFHFREVKKKLKDTSIFHVGMGQTPIITICFGKSSSIHELFQGRVSQKGSVLTSRRWRRKLEFRRRRGGQPLGSLRRSGDL